MKPRSRKNTRSVPRAAVPLPLDLEAGIRAQIEGGHVAAEHGYRAWHAPGGARGKATTYVRGLPWVTYAVGVRPGLALLGVDHMMERSRTMRMKKNPELPFAFAVHAPVAASYKAPARASVVGEWSRTGDVISGTLRVVGVPVLAKIKLTAQGRLHLTARWAAAEHAVGKYSAMVPAGQPDPVAWAEKKLAGVVSTQAAPRVFDWDAPRSPRKVPKRR